jgi:hypothetical protein
MAHDYQRTEVLRSLRPMNLAQALITHGLVDESAVYDPDGYDGGVTLERIYRLSRDLLVIPGPTAEPAALPHDVVLDRAEHMRSERVFGGSQS